LYEVLPKISDKEYAMTATPSIDLPSWTSFASSWACFSARSSGTSVTLGSVRLALQRVKPVSNDVDRPSDKSVLSTLAAVSHTTNDQDGGARTTEGAIRSRKTITGP
jgi:hypothetical protein